MEIEKRNQDGNYLLLLKGRLDTVTSPLLEKELLDCFPDAKNLTLDFASLEYVSSSGLRLILMAYKKMKEKNGLLKLIHVNEEIHEVLEMTGFSDFLTIENE